jgi:hypothetical protein
LNTTTTQNVAWPITMVQKENGICSVPYAERSAMPVITPGNAIGRIKSSEIASRPKNFARASAPAASVPSTSAIAVDQAATSKLRRIAAQTSSRCQATPNHTVVSAGGGKT